MLALSAVAELLIVNGNGELWCISAQVLTSKTCIFTCLIS